MASNPKPWPNTGKPDGHKIEAETYLGPERYYNGPVCRVCHRALYSKPGSLLYRHLDYRPRRY